MANDNLKDFIDHSTWDDFARLEKVIESAADSMELLGLTAQKAFKDLGTVANLKELVTLTSKASEVNKQMGDSLKTVTSGVKELNAEQIRQNMTTKERNDLLKLQVAAEAAPAGSIAKVRAEAALLRKELISLNIEKEKGRQEDIKAQLATKDAYIKENVDAYTAQKINIGNYPQAMAQMQELRKEMEALAASGQKDTEEFIQLDAKMRQFQAGLGPTNQQIATITSSMHQLAAEGKQDTTEFHQLASMAAELKGRMNEVKSAVDGATKELEQQKQSSESLKDKLSSWAQGVAGVAAAYFSLQGMATIVAESVEEISQADDAASRLKNTLSQYDNVQAFGRLAEQADEVANKLKYLDNDDVVAVFDKLLTYGKLTETQLNELLPVIVDFAAKEKMGLTDATDTIVKALEGSAKALKVYGIDIKEAADATETAASPAERFALIMEQLKPKVEGAAAAFGTTLPGKLAISKQWFKNVEEEIGRFLVKLSGVEEQQYRSAVAAKKEADETQNLVNEYEILNKKVVKTQEEKKRLSDITTTLVSMYGNSVIEIDKETKAITVNIEATKELIKQKLLLSNQEASTLALKYSDANEKNIVAVNNLTKAQIAYDEAVKNSGITFEKVQKAKQSIGGSSSATMGVGGGGRPLTAQEAEVEKLHDNVLMYQQETNKFEKIKQEALIKLDALGFKESDVSKLFTPKGITPLSDLGDGGKTKTLSANIVENERALTNALLAQYQEQMKGKAEEQKQILETEEETYRARKAALIDYNSFENRAQEAKLLNDYENKRFEINNMEKKANETPGSFAARKRVAEAELVTIEEQMNNLRVENKKKVVAELKKLDEDEVNYKLSLAAEIDKNVEGMKNNALQSEKEQYEKGIITFEQYSKQKLEIEERFNLASLLMKKAYFEQLIKDTAAGDPDTKKYNEALAGVNGQISALPARQKQSTNILGQTDEQWQRTQQIMSEAINLENQLADAVNARYEAEIAALEEKKRLIDENYSAEVAAVNGSFQSEQRKAQQLAILAAQKRAADKKINDEIRAEKRKMAIADKANSIAQAIQGTAVAVINALKIPIVGEVLAGVIAAAGAFQIGNIAATEIPQYGTGTLDHKGGPAIVGELYKPEWIFEDGKAPRMVNKPTLLNMKKGSRVFTEEQMMSGMNGMAVNEMGELIASNATAENIMREEMRGVREEIKDLASAVINKKETHFMWDNNGLRKMVKNGNSWTEYIDSNFQ